MEIRKEMEAREGAGAESFVAVSKNRNIKNGQVYPD